MTVMARTPQFLNTLETYIDSTLPCCGSVLLDNNRNATYGLYAIQKETG